MEKEKIEKIEKIISEINSLEIDENTTVYSLVDNFDSILQIYKDIF